MNNKIAISCMKTNYLALKQDPKWKKFAEEHPDCVIKILGFFARPRMERICKGSEYEEETRDVGTFGQKIILYCL